MSLAVLSKSIASLFSSLLHCSHWITPCNVARKQTYMLFSAVYITANISGGHLNPAVTIATMVTGHIPMLKGLAYIFVQICGACFGMLMVVSSFSPIDLQEYGLASSHHLRQALSAGRPCTQPV